MSNIFYLCLVGFAIISTVQCSTLEAETKKSQPCALLTPAAKVNTTWIKSTEIWFFPYWAQNLTVPPTTASAEEMDSKKVSEQEPEGDSRGCLLVNYKSGDIYCFGKKMEGNSTYHFNSLRPGLIDWEFNGEYGASTYIIMTDNQTYALGVDVFPDGTRGGFVMTPDPNLEKFSTEQVNEWKSKFVEIGFLENEFVHTPLKCAVDSWKELQKKENNDTEIPRKPLTA